MARIAVIFFLVSRSFGMQEIDDASCGTAPAESLRSLIQNQRAQAAPLQVVESTIREEKPKLEKPKLEKPEMEDPKAPPTHSIEFEAQAHEMKIATTQYLSDFPSENVTGNVSKEFLMIDFEGAAATEDNGTAEVEAHNLRKVEMFGFKRVTAGLTFSNATRVWTKHPSKKDAKLASVISVTPNSDTDKYDKYTFHIEFAKGATPAIKYYPEDGSVTKIAGKLQVIITCEDALACKDGQVVLSAIQFKAKGKLCNSLVKVADTSPLSVSSKTSSTALASSQIASSCPLPPNAQWGEVRLEGLPPFNMALRTGDDVLSGAVMRTGNWPELTNVSVYGTPGNALDIGGNIGYYTFALAHAGWKVYTFEPMSENLALIKATLCENPSIAANVKLFEVGLSEKDTTCTMMVNPKNRGNGQVMCGDTSVWPDGEVTGQFSLRRLEDILAANPLSSVDYMKLDVEGYECEALKGAPSFFEHYRPRLVKTEVWQKIQSCTPKQYLDMFLSKGYKLATEEDMECKSPIAGPEEELYKHNGVRDFYLCSS